jgi:hypothetical protein
LSWGTVDLVETAVHHTPKLELELKLKLTVSGTEFKFKFEFKFKLRLRSAPSRRTPTLSPKLLATKDKQSRDAKFASNSGERGQDRPPDFPSCEVLLPAVAPSESAAQSLKAANVEIAPQNSWN